MKAKNERNAGRKPKFTVPYKKVSIPVPIIEEVQEMSKQFLTNKKQYNIVLRCF